MVSIYGYEICGTRKTTFVARRVEWHLNIKFVQTSCVDIQDVFLFSGSVYDNVTLRNDNIKKEQVIEYLNRSNSTKAIKNYLHNISRYHNIKNSIRKLNRSQLQARSS